VTSEDEVQDYSRRYQEEDSERYQDVVDLVHAL
jgi:hypothetical protein